MLLANSTLSPGIYDFSSVGTRLNGTAENQKFGTTFKTTDYNGDGNMDFVVGDDSAFSESRVRMYYGNPANPAAMTPVDLISSSGSSTLALQKIRDINNDGKEELIITESGGSFENLTNNGTIYILSPADFTP